MSRLYYHSPAMSIHKMTQTLSDDSYPMEDATLALLGISILHHSKTVLPREKTSNQAQKKWEIEIGKNK